MKKLIAIILAMAMLCGFAAIGATAAENDLQAQGEALLRETFEILNSGVFTLESRNTIEGRESSMITTMDGDRMATETIINWAEIEPGLQSFVLWLLLGNTMRMVFAPGGTSMVFPERRIYFAMPAASDDFFDMILTMAAEMPEHVAVTEKIVDGITYICVSVEIEGATTSCYYLDGQLKRVVTIFAGDIIVQEIDFFTGTVNQSLFSTSRMVRIPLMLYVWLFSII